MELNSSPLHVGGVSHLLPKPRPQRRKRKSTFSVKNLGQHSGGRTMKVNTPVSHTDLRDPLAWRDDDHTRECDMTPTVLVPKAAHSPTRANPNGGTFYREPNQDSSKLTRA